MKNIVDEKLLEEVKRYNKINSYIKEQDEELGDAPPKDLGLGDDPLSGEEPMGGEELDFGSEEGVEDIPEPIDVASDPDVDVVDDETGEVAVDTEGEGTEELEITDLVDSQQEISDKQDEYMESMFNKLDDLSSKLGEMDKILARIDSLETKFDKYRDKTPEEKLSLRSLDSYPYNQKLTDYFQDKTQEMEASGKNEYVLTPDDVNNFSDSEIRKSFDSPLDDEYELN